MLCCLALYRSATSPSICLDFGWCFAGGHSAEDAALPQLMLHVSLQLMVRVRVLAIAALADVFAGGHIAENAALPQCGAAAGLL